MSKIEVFCRYKKQKKVPNQEEMAYLEGLRIIQNKESIDEVEIEGENEDPFEYGPMTIDLDDIKAFNMVDSKHTCLRMYDSDAFVIKAPYNPFKELYEDLTGKLIKTIEWEEKTDA